MPLRVPAAPSIAFLGRPARASECGLERELRVTAGFPSNVVNELALPSLPASQEVYPNPPRLVLLADFIPKNAASLAFYPAASALMRGALLFKK